MAMIIKKMFNKSINIAQKRIKSITDTFEQENTYMYTCICRYVQL